MRPHLKVSAFGPKAQGWYGKPGGKPGVLRFAEIQILFFAAESGWASHAQACKFGVFRSGGCTVYLLGRVEWSWSQATSGLCGDENQSITKSSRTSGGMVRSSRQRLISE